MKAFFPSILVAATLTACTAKTATNQNTNLPPTETAVTSFIPAKSLSAKFSKDFPNSTRTIWSKNDIRAFVDFRNSMGFNSHATYGFDGTLMENKNGMDINRLPVEIKNYLNTKYPQHTVENSYTVRDGYTKKYILVNLKGTEDVLFDLNGNFITYKP